MTAINGLRIVSDGTVLGTRVFTSDGDDVTSKLQIRSVSWKHVAGGLPTALLECVCAQIDSTDLSCEFVQTAHVGRRDPHEMQVMPADALRK